MARVDEVLAAVRRGIEQSDRMPAGTSYLERQADREGTDAAVTLPAIILTEVATSRDQNRSTDLVGLVRDEDGSVIGRIFEIGFEMQLQIDVTVAAGTEPSVEELTQRVQRALQQYDSQLRADPLPDGEGGSVGDIRQFTLQQAQPDDDFSKTPSLRRQRLEAFVTFRDRLNEVDEYGPLEPIKTVRTPRDGDYEGGLSEDYEIEYQA